MTFPLPQFPLLARVWNPANLPVTNPPNFAGMHCQLYVDPHAVQFLATVAPLNASIVATTWAKFPVGSWVFLRGGILMIPELTGTYYKIQYKEIFYQGFPQQYEGVLVVQCDANGTIPRTY